MMQPNPLPGQKVINQVQSLSDMRKVIRGIVGSPATTVTGAGAGILQIQQGIETRNYWLLASGVLTVLMGIFAKDGGK